MKYRWLAWAMPVAFLAVAWLMVQLMLPPSPVPHPVQKLREGKVRIGDSVDKVESILGRWPNGIVRHPDGTFAYIYYQTAADADFTNEDATVEFDTEGRVTAIRFDRSQAPSPSPNN